jgi:hypothetical protein
MFRSAEYDINFLTTMDLNLLSSDFSAWEVGNHNVYIKVKRHYEE